MSHSPLMTTEQPSLIWFQTMPAALLTNTASSMPLYLWSSTSKRPIELYFILSSLFKAQKQILTTLLIDLDFSDSEKLLSLRH